MSNRPIPWLTLIARLVLLATLVLVVAGEVLRVFDFRQVPDYGEGTILAATARSTP